MHIKSDAYKNLAIHFIWIFFNFRWKWSIKKVYHSLVSILLSISIKMFITELIGSKYGPTQHRMPTERTPTKSGWSMKYQFIWLICIHALARLMFYNERVLLSNVFANFVMWIISVAIIEIPSLVSYYRYNEIRNCFNIIDTLSSQVLQLI